MLRAASMLLLIALLSAFSAAPAQTPAIPVFVSIGASDGIGQRMGEAVVDRLRKKSNIRLVDRAEDGRFNLTVQTLNPDEGAALQISTIYSSIVLLRSQGEPQLSIFLASFLGRCTPDLISICAMTNVELLDMFVSAWTAFEDAQPRSPLQ